MVVWTADFVMNDSQDELMDAFAQLMNEYSYEATLFDSGGDVVLTNGKG